MFQSFLSKPVGLTYYGLGEGIVQEIVRNQHEWRVEFQDSYWMARSLYPISLTPGDIVRVLGIDNITLIVDVVN